MTAGSQLSSTFFWCSEGQALSSAIPTQAGIFAMASESSRPACYRTSTPFLFRNSPPPWIAWEWGADVLMGASHRVAGLAGVALI